MRFFVILACFAIQRFAHVRSVDYRIAWLSTYVDWVKSKVAVLSDSSIWLSICVFVLPSLIVVAIVSSLFFHLLGWIGYFIFSALLFWYFTDCCDFSKDVDASQGENALINQYYVDVFAPLFWYALLGPVGLVLYTVVLQLSALDHKVTDARLAAPLDLLLIILNWVPLRLLGLTLALSGHFSSVFKLWFVSILKRLPNDGEVLSQWTLSAAQIHSESTEEPLSAEEITEIISLYDRTLIIWLAVGLLVLLAGVFG